MTFEGATRDPIQRAVRDALIAIMAAGIKASRQAGDAAIRYRGRKPTFDVEQLHGTSELLSMGMSPSAIAAEVGIPRVKVSSAEGAGNHRRALVFR